MVNVSVDLAQAQLEFLQQLLNTGAYRSRSEAVRDILRRAELEQRWRAGLRETAQKKLSLADLEASRNRNSPRLLKRFSNA